LLITGMVDHWPLSALTSQMLRMAACRAAASEETALSDVNRPTSTA
jgi:hypothetical protein